jgi:hypothetical protein
VETVYPLPCNACVRAHQHIIPGVAVLSSAVLPLSGWGYALFTVVRGRGILRSWPRMFSCAGCMVGKYLELDETTTDGGVDKVATTMMTKTYFEDLGKIAESNAKSAQQSARIATEYWVASRERNNKAAQEITRTLTGGIKRQTKADEDLTSRVFEILEERDEAHKRFFEQWAEAFTSVPFEYTRQATREAQKKTANLR